MDRNLIAIFGITLIGIIGVSILSPAFPEIKRGLGISDFEVAMLVTAFTLPGTFLAPLIGVLADRIGRKKVVVPCLLLFGIAGSACAFVDYKLMLILRFLQGIGGSALTSLAVTLIGDLYDGLERAKVLGYNAGILSLGLAGFPFLGGVLADVNWKLPFLMFSLAIPVGLMALGIDYPSISDDRSLKRYFAESLALLRSKKVLVGFLSGCTVFVITYGAITIYLSFLLEERFGLTPGFRGIIIALTFVFVAVIASNLGYFVKRFGETRTVIMGFLSYALSLIIIPFAPNIVVISLAMLIFGFGHGTVLPALQNLVVSIAPTENRAVVTSTYSSMIRIGQTIGPIFASAIAVYSIDLVFLVSSLLAFSFAILNWMTDY